MINEVDEAQDFFSSEVLHRLKETAALISQIEKNPNPAKLNQLKKHLLDKKIKKKADEYGEDTEDEFEKQLQELYFNEQEYTYGDEVENQKELLYSDNEVIDIG